MRPSPLVRFAAALYVVALMLVVVPFADYFTSIIPAQTGSLQWRFGTSGLFSGFLITPMLGLVLMLLVAEANEHHGLQRFLGVSSVVMALVLVALLGLFALDALQLRREVPPGDQKVAFTFSAVRTGLKYSLMSVVFVVLGVAGFRRGGSAAAKARPREATPLIVGREAAKA